MSPDLRISHLEAPEIADLDRPVQVTVHATNFGQDASQGYLSVSFPSAVREVNILRSDLKTQIAFKGDPWKGGEVILRYPIAECYVHPRSGDRLWKARESHFITVEFTPMRRGLVQFYVACRRARVITLSSLIDASRLYSTNEVNQCIAEFWRSAKILERVSTCLGRRAQPSRRIGRGRDHPREWPPARIRTGRITACGSYLG
jgi:hypothetical protein